MENVWELHEATMELINKANHSSKEEAHRLLIQAYELEYDTAMELADTIDLSPQRSVIFEQAIKLGIQLGRFEEVAQLVSVAQQGYVHKNHIDSLNKYEQDIAFILGQQSGDRNTNEIRLW